MKPRPPPRELPLENEVLWAPRCRGSWHPHRVQCFSAFGTYLEDGLLLPPYLSNIKVASTLKGLKEPMVSILLGVIQCL